MGSVRRTTELFQKIAAEGMADHVAKLHKKPRKIEENMLVFDVVRKAYPGTKRGLETEFYNFVWQSKHPKAGMPPFNFVEVLPLLKPAIKAQIQGRQRAKLGDFVPPWKNFKTWINNRCWEEEGKIVYRPLTPEEKATLEKAEAAASEKRRQEIRNDEGRYYREQSTEDLEKWLADPKCIVRHWLIKEILTKRAAIF